MGRHSDKLRLFSSLSRQLGFTIPAKGRVLLMRFPDAVGKSHHARQRAVAEAEHVSQFVDAFFEDEVRVVLETVERHHAAAGSET